MWGLQVIAEVSGTSLPFGLATLVCGLRSLRSGQDDWMPVAGLTAALALVSVGGAAGLFILRPGGAFAEYGGLYPLDPGLWAVALGAVVSGVASTLLLRKERGRRSGVGA